MPTMAEMVEAHLTNVQREINTLQERKAQIDAEINRLETYLKDGAETLNTETKPVESVTPEPAPTSPVFGNTFGGQYGE